MRQRKNILKKGEHDRQTDIIMHLFTWLNYHLTIDVIELITYNFHGLFDISIYMKVVIAYIPF